MQAQAGFLLLKGVGFMPALADFLPKPHDVYCKFHSSLGLGRKKKVELLVSNTVLMNFFVNLSDSNVSIFSSAANQK